YPRTKPEELTLVHRIKTIISKIVALNADIVLLQEVDEWETLWLPNLPPRYQGQWYAKEKKSANHMSKVGVAILYRMDSERKVAPGAVVPVDLDQLADTHKNEDFRRGNTGLCMVFTYPPQEDLPIDNYVVVGNVHTHWDPAFENLKLQQVLATSDAFHQTITAELEKSKRPVGAFPRTIPITRVLGGDWNLLRFSPDKTTGELRKNFLAYDQLRE